MRPTFLKNPTYIFSLLLLIFLQSCHKDILEPQSELDQINKDRENEQGGCETAFANGEISFDDLAVRNQSRWGWVIPVRSPYSHSYALYAAAGRRDVTNGTEVGRVYIEHDFNTLTVRINSYPGVTISESHVYVSEDLPRKLSPGTFDHKHEGISTNLDEYSIDISNMPFFGYEGESLFYVIVHAVTCGTPSEEEPEDEESDIYLPLLDVSPSIMEKR